jgi:uridine phosphorylase
MRQYHVQLEPGEIGEYVLLPGDPARSELIASRFDGPRHVRSNREFTTWTGSLDGVPVSVCSTGIGSPSTAIAAEELIRCGARTLIRVGTCGGLQPELRLGDLVVMSAAVRFEGTSAQYAPLAFPAVADLDVSLALRDAAAALGHAVHVGTTLSVDSFYSEIEPDSTAIETSLREQMTAWVRSGVIAAEMECGALYVLAAARRARAGALCVVSDAVDDHMPEHGRVSLDALLDSVRDGLRLLIGAERAATR